MKIIEYTEEYKQEVIDMILHIQNQESKINLSLEEQPDLLDVKSYYTNKGGKFWLAVEDGRLIGTIALMNFQNGNGVLKKFFVRKEFRNQKIGLALYRTLYDYAVQKHYKNILLDTPSVAEASHRFYEKSGFHKTDKNHMPFAYDYPDRDSYLYLLALSPR